MAVHISHIPAVVVVTFHGNVLLPVVLLYTGYPICYPKNRTVNEEKEGEGELPPAYRCGILKKTGKAGERAMGETKLHPVITVRLYTDEKCFGPGVAMLLERVDRLHSLRSAAMDMDMAYSKAWTILRNAEKCLGFKLISSTTGGRHGGGAVLTPEGERMLSAYQAFAREIRMEGEALFQKYFSELPFDGEQQ